MNSKSMKLAIEYESNICHIVLPNYCLECHKLRHNISNTPTNIILFPLNQNLNEFKAFFCRHTLIDGRVHERLYSKLHIVFDFVQ